MNDNPMPQAPPELSGLTDFGFWNVVVAFIITMTTILTMAVILESDISEFQQACKVAGGVVLSGECVQKIQIKPKIKVMT